DSFRVDGDVALVRTSINRLRRPEVTAEIDVPVNDEHRIPVDVHTTGGAEVSLDVPHVRILTSPTEIQRSGQANGTCRRLVGTYLAQIVCGIEFGNVDTRDALCDGVVVRVVVGIERFFERFERRRVSAIHVRPEASNGRR